MIDSETICPYTGLRSFTEEESLYFKGREEHILGITAQLEEKKFLMVTGASGDGKSSLIFAGLIPQARAGFFKAEYSDWYVADFRPERTPMHNMSMALATNLGYSNPSTVEVELSRGFSSLVDLYKSSDRYIDKSSEQWKNASEEKRGEMERSAGNLLILIDQFEEFFTNPENFPGGVPSQESRLLLNIILETAKISLKENLPIYIICTMRSDYIGQCASFRGLPEFIGFSQFFVPRLKRKELHQVIEEPAILSGNRISNRLIDRLIFDLEEGTDQLPTLQHALKQIWRAANNGKEEMDLIHYAMVGGMVVDQLPKEDINRFNAWKKNLPDYELLYLKHSGLSNVLDIHANKLYEEAADYYNKKSEHKISAKQAKLIIGISFACLTRIDENRAVRNRMTLKEITQIINVPQLNATVVSDVLSIFREPENTLIRPFIDDSEREQTLDPSTVLDITHEALIRNWKLLKKWADQEYDYFVTYLDFQKQVDRWIENGKSSTFLLPIGTLSYFENWYKKCRPNQFWINRYNSDEPDTAIRLSKSQEALSNGRNYLRQSALRLLATRTFMKYGAARVSIIAGSILVLLSITYFIFQWRTHTNQYILNQIQAEGVELLNNKEADQFTLSYFTVDLDRQSPGFFMNAIRQLPLQRGIDVSISVVNAISDGGLKSNPPILKQSLLVADSLIQVSSLHLDMSPVPLTNYLNNLNDIVRNQSHYLYLRSDEKINQLRDRNVDEQKKSIYKILSQNIKPMDMKTFHITTTDALTFGQYDTNEVNRLINLISPFDGGNEAGLRFKNLFPKNEKIIVGAEQNVSHNGGYQLLAYLYAASGNAEKATQSIDSLKKYNAHYDKLFNNSSQVGAYFLLYNKRDAFEKFVKLYSVKLKVPAFKYLSVMLSGVGVTYVDHIIKFIKRGNLNDNIRWLDSETRRYLFSFARELVLAELKLRDEINFELSLLYKLEGSIIDKLNYQKTLMTSGLEDSLFSLSLEYFEKVSDKFRNEIVSMEVQTNNISTEKRQHPRKHLFLYPDYLRVGEGFNQPDFFRFYGVSFYKFMLRNNLFSKYYTKQKDYDLIEQWLEGYFHFYKLQGNGPFLFYPELEPVIFESLDSLLLKSQIKIDDAWIKLMLIRNAFQSGDTTEAMMQIDQLDFKSFEKLGTNDRNAFHNTKLIVAGEFAVLGKRKECLRIINRFLNPRNQIKAYARIAVICFNKENLTEAQYYLDSALSKLNRLRNVQGIGADYRLNLVEALALEDKDGNEQKAKELIGTMAWFSRAQGVRKMVWAYSSLNDYYRAKNTVPKLSSNADWIDFYDFIIFHENQKPKYDSPEWKSYDEIILYGINFTPFENDLITN